MAVLQVEEQFAGPVPPPEILRRYNEVIPDGAERIFATFESQVQHRHRIEKTVVEGNSRRAWVGLVLGFVLALAFLAAAVSLVLAGYEIAGAVIGGIDVVGLVTVFVVGKREQRVEREHKSQQ